MAKSLGSMNVDGRKIYFYEEKVGTVGTPLRLVSAWNRPINASRSGFMGEVPLKKDRTQARAKRMLINHIRRSR